MKTFTKFLTMLAVALFFATGCVNEEPPYKGEPTPPPADAEGHLALGGMSMRVIYDDQTDIRPDDTSDEMQKPAEVSVTRANPDVANFIVEIFDQSTTSVFKKTYGELNQMEPLPLPVGSYRMEVRSEETIPDYDWEHPVYGASYDFKIAKAETTQIGEVVCMLQNIKVTVACSADLLEMLSETTVSTVSLGNNRVEFARGENRAAYFKPLATVNTLDFNLEGTFADTGGPVKFSKKVEGVKAGQWRKITLVIEYADKGDVRFDIKVDGFVQDDEVVVNGTDNLWEPLLEDPEDPTAPALSWPGHDMTQPFRLTDAMFDANGNCTEPFAFDLAAPNGIESLRVTIGSTSSRFMASLAAINIPAAFDLCTLDPSTPAAIILKGFGFPVGSELKGQQAKRFDIAGQMKALYEFDGTHTFTFEMTDAKNMTGSATLTLVVDKGTAPQNPEIEWMGYDLTKLYELDDVESIKVNIKAQPGIQSLVITIISEDLAPLLAMAAPDLLDPFDLCTITGAGADFLAELGFPLGGEVRDQTTLLFDISRFIPVLKEIYPNSGGNTTRFDFHLKVTDNNGNSTEGTLQFKHVLQ